MKACKNIKCYLNLGEEIERSQNIIVYKLTLYLFKITKIIG